MIFQNNLNRNLLLFLILLFGAIISYHRGSNFSDGDSYSVILAFLNFIDNGIYTPSRGAYGHPIPEFIIGLTSYYLGTSYSNILCFTFLFFALIFLYKTFLNNTKSLFLFVNDNVLAPTSSSLATIYKDHQDKDGFLYITYCLENTFGKKIDN